MRSVLIAKSKDLIFHLSLEAAIRAKIYLQTQPVCVLNMLNLVSFGRNFLFKWLGRKKRKQAKALRQHLTSFSVFYPNSHNYWLFPELTYNAANRLPAQLCHFLSKEVSIVDYKQLQGDPSLESLFNKYGSDKNSHGYASIYSDILSKIGTDKINMLEIGLGTNNPDLISSMGEDGKPGASLRAFRDFLPNAAVYGADIDKNILFNDDRIQTFWIDQTDIETYFEASKLLDGKPLTLTIDDGLHSTEANLNTLRFWLETAPIGGWIVIEDIPERSLDVWKISGSLLLEKGQSCTIFKAADCYVFAAEKTQQ